MPTYEYACQSCQQVFDVFQSMRDAPLTVCPKCGKEGVKRLIGRGAGIIFKGSGFYETDYKRQPEKKTGTDAAAASSSPAASTPASSTPAPAANNPAAGSSKSPSPAPAKTN